MMQLVLPTLAMKGAYEDFVREWAQHSEEITPYSARLLGKSYEEWLACAKRRETESVDGLVPDHTYFWVDDTGAIIGAVNLRHTLNEHLFRVCGHIGYGVRPSARRRGHAKAMLLATLPHAKALGLTRVLVTCDKQNTASARTILFGGGVLENEVQNENGETIQRYWIEL